MKIDDLVRELYEYNQVYRLGIPKITDKEYDDKVEKLRILAPNHSFFNKGIQINVNDENFSRTRQQALPLEMRSLDKIKSIDELNQWFKLKNLPTDIDVIITPKYDGISILCNENVGQYWTSGDGFIGQNVTEHIDSCLVTNKLTNYCKFYSMKQDSTFFSIGELIISKKNWEKHFVGRLNPRSKKLFKSARNTVAGMMNNDNPNTITHFLQYCHYIPYTLVLTHLSNINYYNSKEVQLKTLYGESTEKFCLFEIRKAYEITESFLNLMFERWSKDFVIDGIVIDINDSELREQCGFEANSNPGFARAYKDPNWSETKETIVKNIKMQISKHGTAKPVIEIEPINLASATISNVNGINAKYVSNWKLGKGQIITITRSGEVIPKIIKVRDTEIPFRENFTSLSKYEEVYQKALSNFASEFNHEVNVPVRYRKNNYFKKKEFSINQFIENKFKYCPYCNSDLIWDENRIDLKCSNLSCFERKCQQILFFFETMNVRDIGGKTIRSFMSFEDKCKTNPFTTAKSILNMTIADISSFEGFQSSSAFKLYRQFQKILKVGVSFAKLSYAMTWFEDLGEKTIQSILNNLGLLDLADLIRFSALEDKVDRLCRIDGISEISAFKFVNKLDYALSECQDWNINQYAEENIQILDGKLNGNKFVFSQFRDTTLRQKILNLGGRVLDSLTKETTHLIVLDKKKITGKVTKALQYGTIIWDKKELINFLNK